MVARTGILGAAASPTKSSTIKVTFKFGSRLAIIGVASVMSYLLISYLFLL